jgi:hypothetical protein
MVVPSSRFSKTIATGVRVPLKTQAPLAEAAHVAHSLRSFAPSSESVRTIRLDRRSLGEGGDGPEFASSIDADERLLGATGVRPSERETSLVDCTNHF